MTDPPPLSADTSPDCRRQYRQRLDEGDGWVLYAPAKLARLAAAGATRPTEERTTTP